MTEDEAKTKMCCGPQVVAMVIGLAAPNLKAEITEEAGRCIGSLCMAWRWDENDVPFSDEIAAPNGGFCGLAGAPQ